MTFDEWFDTLPKFPSPDDVYFRHFMGKAWDAALKFAQQPQGATPPENAAPSAAPVVQTVFEQLKGGCNGNG